MIFLHRNKNGLNKKEFSMADYSVLDYDQLLKVNGAKGSSGGSGPSGPSDGSSSNSNGPPIPLPSSSTNNNSSSTSNNSYQIELPEYHAPNQNGWSVGSDGVSYTNGNITVYGSADGSASYSPDNTGNSVTVNTNNGSIISTTVATPLGTVDASLNSVTIGIEIRY